MNDSTWTWMSGSDTANQNGYYGTQGVSSSMNVPSARTASVGWFNSVDQELWLFGGRGINEGAQGTRLTC